MTVRIPAAPWPDAPVRGFAGAAGRVLRIPRTLIPSWFVRCEQSRKRPAPGRSACGARL